MRIGNKEYKEIVITGEDDEVIASITDIDIIEKDGYTVQLYPDD